MKQHAFSPVYLLFVLLCIIVCSCFCTELPFFSTPVSNSPYSAFKLVGEQFSQRIKQYVQQSSTLNDRLIPWVHANSANKQIFLDFVTSNRIVFPDYFQEIEGYLRYPLLPEMFPQLYYFYLHLNYYLLN